MEALLYCPATHDVQFTAPGDANVSVTDPAEHVAHATVDALLYFPDEQAVQFVAAVRVRVSVVDPVGHSKHGSVEELPYNPGEQTVHVVAPPISVISTPPLFDHDPEDDWDQEPDADPVVPETSDVMFSGTVVHPAGHIEQAMVDVLLYCPGKQGSQEMALVKFKVSVIDPGSHKKQFVCVGYG